MNIKNLVSGKEQEIIKYITDFYDIDLHGDEHWFNYEIDNHEVDVKVVFEDELITISVYPVDFGYYDEFVTLGTIPANTLVSP